MMEFLKPEICNDLGNQTCFKVITNVTHEPIILVPIIITFSFLFLWIFINGFTKMRLKKERSTKIKFLIGSYWFSTVLPLLISMLILFFTLIYPIWSIFII